MNAGLATQNKLHAVNQPDPHQSDDDYVHRHGRASDKVMGYDGRDDFTLPRRPFMPSFTATSIGTPGELRRSRASRLYGAYSTVFWIGVALSAALIALSVLHALSSHQLRAADTSIPNIKKATRLVAGTSTHSLNEQGCVVFLHKEIASPVVMTVVSDHC